MRFQRDVLRRYSGAKSCSVFLFALSFWVGAGSTSTLAGGFENCLLSEELTGTACVGAPIVRDHPNAYGNPATLASFNSPTLSVGARAIFFRSNFEADVPSPQGGSGDGKGGKTFIIPSIHSAVPLNDRATLGLSVLSPFGLGLEYDDAWEGRYFVREVGLKTINGTLGLSYRINSNLDVGVGLSVQYADAKVRRAVNNIIDTLPDGSLNVKGDGVSVGYVLGAIWRPDSAPVEVGVSYRSGMKQELEGDADAVGVGPTLSFFGVTSGGAKVEFDLPQQVSVAASIRARPDTSIIVEADWTEWSAFDQTTVMLQSGFIEATPRNWKDTYRVGLAVEHKLDEKWSLRAGSSYETSAVSSVNRLADIPTDRWLGFAAGATRKLNGNASLALSISWFDLGNNRLAVSDPLAGALTGSINQSDLIIGLGTNITF